MHLGGGGYIATTSFLILPYFTAGGGRIWDALGGLALAMLAIIFENAAKFCYWSLQK